MNRKMFFLIFGIISTVMTAQEADFEWVAQMGGVFGDAGRSIATDTQNNVYSIGYFLDTVDFDPGLGTHELTSLGNADMFVQKLDSDGNLLWAKQVGGTENVFGKSIYIDASANILIAGEFWGTVDFDPNSGINNVSSNGSADIFIQKLDLNGNLLWVKHIGGGEFDTANSIVADMNGNVYSTGAFRDTVDFDPNTGISNLFSNGSSDIFIQKLDADGNLIWVKQMGGPDPDSAISIAIDANQNLLTSGGFNGIVDFDPNTGTNFLISNGSSDIFVQKLDSSGNLIWVYQIGGIEDEYSGRSCIDTLGNIYTIGEFQGVVDFDPSSGIFNLSSNGLIDIFIQKLDTNGNLIWVKQIGGSDIDSGRYIFTDTSDNVYSTGYFHGTVDFDPGTGTNILTSIGDNDIFIQKLDTNGNLLWVKQMGGTDSNGGLSLTIDSSNNVYTTGFFNGIVDFDPGSGIFDLTSNGSKDIFIHKLSQDIIMGLNEFLDDRHFIVYPNPSNGQITLVSEKIGVENINIYNINGRFIKSLVVDENKTYDLNISSGIYIMHIETVNNYRIFKLIIK